MCHPKRVSFLESPNWKVREECDVECTCYVVRTGKVHASGLMYAILREIDVEEVGR